MFLSLFLVGSPSLWGRRRRDRSSIMLPDLGQHGRLRGCCLAAHVNCNSLLCRQLLLRRSHVQLWCVELCQSIPSHCKQLLSCCVGGHQFFVGRIFCLAVFSRLSNRFVQGFDAIHQCGNLLRQGLDHALGVLQSRAQEIHLPLQSFLLILEFVQLCLAISLLVIIRCLFFGKNSNHLINHTYHFVKRSLVSFAQSQSDEIKLRPSAMRLRKLQDCQCALFHRNAAGLCLDERWTWKCLLEEFERVVIIQ